MVTRGLSPMIAELLLLLLQVSVFKFLYN